jgi:cell division protein ZipA
MIERDTIVLVLGLLIIGVFVRGLIVAIRARKNQLRFALEKSSPDIENPDEIDFSELPQGGARVVAKQESDEEPRHGKASGPPLSSGTDDKQFFDDFENEPPPYLRFNERRAGFVRPVETYDASKSTKKELGLTDFPKDEESGFEFDFENSSDISKLTENNGINKTGDINGEISVSVEDRIGFTQTPDRASRIPVVATEFAEQGKSFFSRFRLRKQITDDSDPSVTDLLFSEYANDDEHVSANGSATENNQGFHSIPDEKLTSGSVEDVSYIQKRSASEQSPEILVVNVIAKEGRLIRGEELLNFFDTQSLYYGEMNIFHKYIDDDFKNPSIFRVVNMLNPGTFDLKKMSEFTTFGVSFFLSLPSCLNNFDAFEHMLLVAKNLQESLGAELRDDQRNAMTEQTIEHYRQRVRNFELASLRARGNNE